MKVTLFILLFIIAFIAAIQAIYAMNRDYEQSNSNTYNKGGENQSPNVMDSIFGKGASDSLTGKYKIKIANSIVRTVIFLASVAIMTVLVLV